MQLNFGDKKFFGRYSLKEYYEQFHVFKTLKELVGLFGYDHIQCIESNLSVSFNGVAFGESFKEIKKAFGRPLYRIDNSGNIGRHEKLFYKLNFGAFTAITQLHLLNDEFFLGQYFFHQIGLAKLTLTKELLIQKYSGRPAADPDNFVIRDENNNRIMVSKDSFGIIHYLSGNDQIRECLMEEIHAKQRQALTIEQMQKQELISFL